MTQLHRGDDFSGVDAKGILLVVFGLLVLLPLKVVLTALSIVVIVVGFQLTIAVTMFVVMFAILGAIISMPFIFGKEALERWATRDERRAREHESNVNLYVIGYGMTPEDAEMSAWRIDHRQSPLTWQQMLAVNPAEDRDAFERWLRRYGRRESVAP